MKATGKSTRVCVTGGSGYIANHIVKALLDHEDNFTVVATVRNKLRINNSGTKIEIPNFRNLPAI